MPLRSAQHRAARQDEVSESSVSATDAGAGSLDIVEGGLGVQGYGSATPGELGGVAGDAEGEVVDD